MNPVLVRGDGVAAYCCFHLLGEAGIPARIERPGRTRLPAIMLSEPAIRLIADVFKHENLFRDLPRIQSRTVLWGRQSAAVQLPHSAVVVSEEVLLESIRPTLHEKLSSEPAPASLPWHVYAARPLPQGAVEHRFGDRTARASAVEIRNCKGPGCWAESTDDGWLFLIANQDGTGSLLCVGDETDRVLARSRLVAEQIERMDESRGEFPCAPRIVAPLCGQTEEFLWLACGAAAIGFDPICGDGTAHAIREAVLAAAVIRAIEDGADQEPLFAHYEARLTAGFQRHLEHSVGFYKSGGLSPWWSRELAEAERGIAWCAKRMDGFLPFRYRLNGFELEAVA